MSRLEQAYRCQGTKVSRRRRPSTEARSASVDRPSRSGRAKILAAATASRTARLMPTPPMGDMVCAVSPMHSTPGLCHVISWSTPTVNCRKSSKLRISPGAVGKERSQLGDGAADRVKALGLDRFHRAFGDGEAALPVLAAADADEDAAVRQVPAAPAHQGAPPARSFREPRDHFRGFHAPTDAGEVRRALAAVGLSRLPRRRGTALPQFRSLFDLPGRNRT